MRKVLVFLIVGMLGLQSCAQSKLTKFRCELKASYIKGNMDNWPELIREMEKFSDGSFDWQQEILQARYGLIGYYMGTGKKDLARDLLAKSDDILHDLLTKYPNSAKLTSVHAGFYGYKMALAIFKAPFLLPKHSRSIERASELDKNEPLAWLEKGNSLYNKPAAFGGDKLQAIESYRTALELMKKQPGSDCNWMVVLVQVFLVKAYYQTNQGETYRLAKLQLTQDYGQMDWVTKFIDVDIVN